MKQITIIFLLLKLVFNVKMNGSYYVEVYVLLIM